MFEVIQIEDRRICLGYFIPFVFPNSIPCPVASHAGHESQRRPTGIQLFFGLAVFSRNRQCHSPLLQEQLLKRACSLIQNILDESKSDVRASRAEEESHRNSTMET